MMPLGVAGQIAALRREVERHIGSLLHLANRREHACLCPVIEEIYVNISTTSEPNTT